MSITPRHFIVLLLTLCLTTACQPVLPPEALAYFSPERVPLSNRVASAVAAATTDSPFVILYPELRTAAAPRWLRPAVRVTYRVESATFAQFRDDPTPSGEGLLQYDVIAQNRQNVVFVSTLINTQIPGQLPAPLSYQVSLPGAGEIWLSPQVLESAESAHSETFQVTRLPLEVEGNTYDVVRMQSNTITDAGSGEDVWAFDSETGLLVFYRQALYRLDGSQRSGTTMTLLARRQLRLPWRNGSVPDWVEPRVDFTMSGSHTVDVGVPPATSLPMTSYTRITRVGALWSEYDQAITLYGQNGGSSSGVTGVAQIFGGFWLPAEALDVLETGDVIDEDPLTGIQTWVAQANRQQVVLAAAGPGYLSQLTYNARNGALIAIYLEQHTASATLYTNLAIQN